MAKRKFKIWIDGYASDNTRIVETDGEAPKLRGLEVVAYEIKSAASPDPWPANKPLPFDTAKDNS